MPATYIGRDTTTRGSWVGVYGADGHNLMGQTAVLPAYVTTFTPTGNGLYTYADNLTDTRAMQKHADPTGTRIASVWHTNQTTNATFSVRIVSSKTARLAIYCLDWDNFGPRDQWVRVKDTATGTLLDEQRVNGFHTTPVYLLYDVSGDITIDFVRIAGNAVASGFLFSSTAVSPNTPPTVTVDQFAPTSVRITAGAYSHPSNTAQQAREFRVRRVSDGVIAYGPVSTAPGTTENTATGLVQDTQYIAEVRDQDTAGVWSGWGTSPSFTTPLAPAAPTVGQPPAGSAFRYWRVFATSDSGTLACAELELFANGQDVAVGGAPLAAGSSGGIPENAFDKDPQTYWRSLSASAAGNFIGYAFAAGVAHNIRQIAYRARNDQFAAGDSPRTLTVQYSETGNHWVDVWTETNIGNWAAGQRRIFTAPPMAELPAPVAPVTAADLVYHWRANCLAGKTEDQPLGLGDFADQSGKGNHPVSLTGIELFGILTYRGNGAGTGKPAARWRSTRMVFPNLFGVGTATPADSGEIFVRLMLENDPPVEPRWTGLYEFGGVDGTKVPDQGGVVHDSFGSTALRRTNNPPHSLLQPWNYNATSQPGYWANFTNGVLLHSEAANTVGFKSAPEFGAGLDGRVVEIRIYRGTLTAAGRQSVTSEMGGPCISSLFAKPIADFIWSDAPEAGSQITFWERATIDPNCR